MGSMPLGSAYVTLVSREGTSVREKIGPLLKRLREQRGLTQGQLATYSGVTRSWIARVEAGHREKPEHDLLLKIAPVLRVPPETLLAAAGYRTTPLPIRERRAPYEVLRELEATMPLMLPVEEVRVSAGGAVGVPTEYQAYYPEEGERGHQFRCLEVTGSCLEPDVRHGDRVIVDVTRRWEPGDMVAVVHDGELLVKWAVRRDGEMVLEANDGTVVQPDERTRVVGIVVQAVRPVERRTW